LIDARHEGRLVGHQLWRDLLFIHQPAPIDVLRPLVPPELAIDTFEGRAWVTLIPFSILASRPIGVPRALAMDFLEVNLRTYVRAPDGEPGIYFFSLEASSWLAVAGARASYGLPYFPAAMRRHEQADGTKGYLSRRYGSGASLETAWKVGAALPAPAPGSLEHFLVERYMLFVVRRRRVYGARVRHQPYPLFQASVDSLRESLCHAAGLPALPFPPALAHGSPGVDVEIHWRQRI
jgi:uncharacterized protein YqjF (DUF2071 family)